MRLHSFSKPPPVSRNCALCQFHEYMHMLHIIIVVVSRFGPLTEAGLAMMVGDEEQVAKTEKSWLDPYPVSTRIISASNTH